MAYWEAQPDARLADFAEAFCFSTDPAGGPSEPVRVTPDGRVDLLISVDDRGAGTAVFFGAKTRSILVRTDRRVENLALRIRPAAAQALLRVPADELTDRTLDAREIFGPAAIDVLLDAPSLAERGARLQRLLLARADAIAARLDRRLLGAAELVLARGGQLRVARLARELGWSERQLERRFRAAVGVGPKMFARIARFCRAWDELARGGAAVEVALERGYFDQSHLVRDFRAFAGAAPRRIFPSQGEAARAKLPA